MKEQIKRFAERVFECGIKGLEVQIIWNFGGLGYEF